MELLKNSAEELGISLSEAQLKSLEKYMDMLLSFNEKINLTAITEKNDILIKHFLDSMTLILSDKLTENASVIDIGAGAGFPSVPLKTVRPDLKITMLDSLNKRVDFLNAVICSLNLTDICAVHMRAEDAGKTSMRESFDISAARAVASLSVLAEYALPFVRVGGYFLAMKGTAPEEEINASKAAIKELGGKIEDVKNVFIRPGCINHTIVIVKKIRSTPSKYPRKAGKPVKDPIK